MPLWDYLAQCNESPWWERYGDDDDDWDEEGADEPPHTLECDICGTQFAAVDGHRGRVRLGQEWDICECPTCGTIAWAPRGFDDW